MASLAESTCCALTAVCGATFLRLRISAEAARGRAGSDWCYFRWGQTELLRGPVGGVRAGECALTLSRVPPWFRAPMQQHPRPNELWKTLDQNTEPTPKVGRRVLLKVAIDLQLSEQWLFRSDTAKRSTLSRRPRHRTVQTQVRLHSRRELPQPQRKQKARTHRTQRETSPRLRPE